MTVEDHNRKIMIWLFENRMTIDRVPQKTVFEHYIKIFNEEGTPPIYKTQYAFGKFLTSQGATRRSKRDGNKIFKTYYFGDNDRMQYRPVMPQTKCPACKGHGIVTAEEAKIVVNSLAFK